MSHRSMVAPSVAAPLRNAVFALLSLCICVVSSTPTAARPAAVAAAGASGVDLNTADAATLARELQGIGESRARAIVEHRRRHGPFRSVDELALVRGIGPKTVERNRARLRIGGGGPATAGARVGAGGAAGVTVSRPASRAASPPQDEGPIIIEGLPREGG